MAKELEVKHILCGDVSENGFRSADTMQFTSSSHYYLKDEEYGKTYFLVYNGQLRQFRVLRTIVFPFNWGIKRKDCYGKNYYNVIAIEVAGVGRLNVGCYYDNGKLDFPIYKSVEDYKNGNEYKPFYFKIDKETWEKVYGMTFTCNEPIFNSDYNLYRWYWNGTCAEKRMATDLIPICFVRDEKGVHFPENWSRKDLSGYFTKEECEKDNEISVCCFEGEEPEPEEKEKTIRLSVEIKESDLPRLKEFVKVID